MGKRMRWVTYLMVLSLAVSAPAGSVLATEAVQETEEAVEAIPEQQPGEEPTAEPDEELVEQPEQQPVEQLQEQPEKAPEEESAEVSEMPVEDQDDAWETEAALGIGDTEELFAEYAGKLFYGTAQGPSAPTILKKAKNTGAGLKGQDKVIYDALRKAAGEIADGRRNSAVVDVPLADLGIRSGEDNGYTAEELGLDYIYDWDTRTWNPDRYVNLRKLISYDFEKVKACLIADCPYEFYWTTGVISYTNGSAGSDGNTVYFTDDSISFLIEVESKYRGDPSDIYSVNTAVTGQAAAAADLAAGIVGEAAALGDYEKLAYYKDRICGLVTYDHDAARNSAGYTDRGPWALIYVFDGDRTTNVVCEGYSEAFQYLCDQTDFSSGKICAYCVTGDMRGGTGEGPHKWNIVHMDDGHNYLADITNSDEGSTGEDGKLFLKGVTGSVAEGYTRSWEEREETVTNADGSTSTYIYPAGSILYTYDEETKALFTQADLTVSELDYGDNEPIEEPEPAVIYGASLRLTGDIGVNFYYEFSEEMLNDPEACVTIKVGEGTLQTVQTLHISDAAVDTRSVPGKTLYKFTGYAAAKRMKDPIVIQAHDTDYEGKEYTYSIRQYADNIIAREGSIAELKYLMRVMMHYGTSAQRYLNYRTSDLAETGLDVADITAEADALTVEDLAAYTASTTPMPEGLSLYGANLSLKSETVVRFHFEVAEGHNISEYTFKVNGKGGYTPVLKSGRYCIEINNVRAQDLDTMYTVTATDAAGNSGSATYGAMTYVRNIINAGTSKYEQTLIDACRSLYMYNKATEAYLAAKGS